MRLNGGWSETTGQWFNPSPIELRDPRSGASVAVREVGAARRVRMRLPGMRLRIHRLLGVRTGPGIGGLAANRRDRIVRTGQRSRQTGNTVSSFPRFPLARRRGARTLQLLLRRPMIARGQRWLLLLGDSPIPRLVTLIAAWAFLSLVFSGGAAYATNGGVQDPSSASTVQQWASIVFQFGITIVVISAAVFIGIGAFFYFAAGGDAAMAGQGKEIVSRTIFGLVLALVAWVILKTISPQFIELKDPSL